MSNFVQDSSIKIASIEVNKNPDEGDPRIFIEYDRRTGPEAQDWKTGTIRSDEADFTASLEDLGKHSPVNRILSWAQRNMGGPRVDKVSYRSSGDENIITTTSIKYISDDPDMENMRWQAEHLEQIADPEANVHRSIVQAEHGKGYIKLTGIEYRGIAAFDNVQSLMIQGKTMAVTFNPTAVDYRQNQQYVLNLPDNMHAGFMRALKKGQPDELVRLIKAANVISVENGLLSKLESADMKERLLHDMLKTEGSQLYDEITRSETMYQSCQREIGRKI